MTTSSEEIPIIDFHTHLGNVFPTKTSIDLEAETDPPPSVMVTSPNMADVDRLFYRNRPKPLTPSYLKHGLLSLYRKRKMIRGATIPNLRQSMEKNSISRSVVLPVEYADGSAEAPLLGLIKTCLKYTEILPFCSVDPRNPGAKNNLRDYLKLGARGLKLHPNFQDFKPSDPACLKIYEEASRYGLPVIFHSGITGYERHPERIPSALENFEGAISTFPRVTFILGHMGISQYKLAIQLARRYENVYLETSGQPASHIREAIQAAGGDKILFGSDWPFWDPVYPLKAVFEATRGDEILRKMILHENAMRILKAEG